jgi:UDP-N-acetylglucosamine--N-acetylmuramyl-(pentapeptide) pyrophosphoryl-undecaprenol N-acetylglucosamine transferase
VSGWWEPTPPIPTPSPADPSAVAEGTGPLPARGSTSPAVVRQADTVGRTTVVVAGGGTGGHLYPGLAIARALTKLSPGLDILFIGARRGIERTVLPQQPFAFELLDLHPLYRPAVWRNWRTVRGAATAWRRLGSLFSAASPRLVLGTGGYASALTLAYGAAHGIPLVQQIADSYPGLTARWFVRFCREAYLGYPEAIEHLRHSGHAALLDTGNPIEPPPDPRPDRGAARRAWQLPPHVRTVLLIFGGSQGARALNQAVDAWLDRPLPECLGVIWATGASAFDTYARREAETVRVRPYLSPIADAYAASDFVLARAGAMTTAELCAWGLPMVLVPLPTAAADHQSANARALAAAGAAIHVPQRELTIGRLDTCIHDLLGSPDRRNALAMAALARGRPGASETIARRILSLIQLR